MLLRVHTEEVLLNVDERIYILMGCATKLKQKPHNIHNTSGRIHYNTSTCNTLYIIKLGFVCFYNVCLSAEREREREKYNNNNRREKNPSVQAQSLTSTLRLSQSQTP
jgi:hypothetical protein